MKTNTTLQITVCPSCGSQKIKKLRKNWIGNFKGKTYNVPSLEFYECPDCGERIYDRLAMRKIEAISPAFDKKLPQNRYWDEYETMIVPEPV